jgi:hypothetical protein
MPVRWLTNRSRIRCSRLQVELFGGLSLRQISSSGLIPPLRDQPVALVLWHLAPSA